MAGTPHTVASPRMSDRGTQQTKGRTPLPASTARRFASALIDAGVFVAVIVGGTFLSREASDPLSILRLLVVGASVAQLLPEVLLGRTVGKLVAGTKIVDFDGGKASPQQILARTMYKGRVLLNAYSVLRETRGRHDRLAGTVVVRSTQPWQDAQTEPTAGSPDRAAL